MPDIIPINDAESVVPDIFVGCVGYEHRSLEALRQLPHVNSANTKLIYDYQSAEEHCYRQNKIELDSMACTLFSEFDYLLNSLQSYVSAKEYLSIHLDVTSLDRRKIAILLELIFINSEKIRSVVISYFPRKFTEPTVELEEVLEFGPVTPRFVGEASFERDRLSLIVGAGYEFGRVVGAIDALEPELTFCMSPVGTDPRFEHAVSRNNLEFSFLDDPDLLIPYPVLNPYSTYFAIRRLIQAELTERNVLVLPLGPKIFAALSIVVALIYSPAVMVWRYSTVNTKRPASLTDAKASGQVSLFAFAFQ